MELTFQLLNTLESLENKSMHKFADRLANTMIKLADIVNDQPPVFVTPTDVTTPPVTATEVAPKYNDIELRFLEKFKEETMSIVYPINKIKFLEQAFAKNPQLKIHSKAIIDALLEEQLEWFNFRLTGSNLEKIKKLESLLTDFPETSKYSKTIINVLVEKDENFLRALLSKADDGVSDFFPNLIKAVNDSGVDLSEKIFNSLGKDLSQGSIDDKLKILDDFITKYPSLKSQIKPELEKIFKSPDFDVLKLGKFKNIDSAAEFKNLAQAAESLGFIKPDQIDEIGKAINPGTKGQAVIKSLDDQAATRALGEVAKKIPAIKGILPLLGHFIGAVGLIPALIGIISDVNKYGIDKIWEDAELKMKFGENIILLIADIAAMFPGLGLIFGPISIGLQYAFDKKREEILKDQAKEMDEMLKLARPHVRSLVSENPKITLEQIRKSVDKYYNWATANSLKNKEKYEIFLNEEVPQIIKEIKSKEYNPYAEQPMQQMAPGTVQTINTEKPKVTSMPNNKASRTVIANTLKAARELEKDGYYMEADLSTFIALELTKMTR
jgi:hypothetical protein